jgi:hypothetical protein
MGSDDVLFLGTKNTSQTCTFIRGFPHAFRPSDRKFRRKEGHSFMETIP